MRTSLSIIIGTVMTFLIASWAFSPDQAFALRRGLTGVSGSAHVNGVVIGKRVVNERGAELGTVENIVLNNSGCAQYVILSGRFRGARGRLYPLPWNVIARTGPDAVFVSLDPDFLIKAPSFEANHWPNLLESQWETRIHGFYTKASEEKGKPRAGMTKEKGRWKGPATEGTVTPQEKMKNKGRMERERKINPSEMGNQGTSKPLEKNLEKNKTFNQGERKINPSEMSNPSTSKPKEMNRQRMEGNKSSVQPGKSQMMMEHGKSPVERGKSKTMGHEELQKTGPGHAVTPAQPGNPSEKIQ